MSNKIIRISIVLIFMLFSVCLFNFCFAVTSDGVLEDGDYTVESTFTAVQSNSGSTFTGNLIKMNVDFVPFSIENSDANFTESSYNSNVLYTIVNNELRCTVWRSAAKYFYIENNCVRASDSIYAAAVSTCAGFKYDWSTNTWKSRDSSSKQFSYTASSADNIISNFTADIYEYGGNIIYIPPSPPTIDELIANCDFNVRIEFGDSEEVSSNYPIKNHLGMQKVTIIHSLTNWKYYDVKLDMTLEDYGFWINQRFHYSHYSTNMTSDEFKDVDTICIEEPMSILINPNDYLGIYSARAGKYVRLHYKIYNKSTNELILTRTIRFRFDGDGFFILQDSSDISGTILEDSLKDNNGNDLENNTNNIISNGKDFTDVNTDFDFSSGFKLDVDTLKGTLENSIESSKSFFNLFSTFLGLLPIWISTLLYFFLFGVIIITLYRFLRGA